MRKLQHTSIINNVDCPLLSSFNKCFGICIGMFIEANFTDRCNKDLVTSSGKCDVVFLKMTEQVLHFMCANEFVQQYDRKTTLELI